MSQSIEKFMDYWITILEEKFWNIFYSVLKKKVIEASAGIMC